MFAPRSMTTSYTARVICKQTVWEKYCLRRAAALGLSLSKSAVQVPSPSSLSGACFDISARPNNKPQLGLEQYLDDHFINGPLQRQKSILIINQSWMQHWWLHPSWTVHCPHLPQLRLQQPLPWQRYPRHQIRYW
jgi:hypothetical protein